MSRVPSPRPQQIYSGSVTTMDPVHDDSARNAQSVSTSNEPRIAPVTMDTATQFQAEQLEAVGGDDALNLFKTLANHPRLLKRWLPFGGSLLYGNSLSDRDREIVILRVAALCGSDYEWGQHVGIARSAGLGDEEMRSLAPHGDHAGTFTDAERALINAADQLVTQHTVDTPTWETLSGTYDTEQLVSLTLLAGHYAMLAGFLSSAGVQTESPLPRIGEV